MTLDNPQPSTTEHLATSFLTQTTKIDPRSIETIDYIDPAKLAEIIAEDDDLESAEAAE